MIIPSSRYVPFPETEQRIEYRAELENVLGYHVSRCDVCDFLVTGRSDRTVSIVFSGSAVVSIPCSRCLRPVEVEIEFDGDRRLDPEKQRDEDGEPAECFSEDGISSVKKTAFFKRINNAPSGVKRRASLALGKTQQSNKGKVVTQRKPQSYPVFAPEPLAKRAVYGLIGLVFFYLKLRLIRPYVSEHPQPLYQITLQG